MGDHSPWSAGSTIPAIDYVEMGSGPTVLFIPGSYSTHAAWRPMQKFLPAAYRYVGLSLCGYGSTTDTRSREDSGMHHQVRVVEEAARRAGGPVHLVGHSFGATVALAFALAGSVEVASLALFEANPLDVVRRSANALYLETVDLSRRFEAAVDAGEADAPALIIDFWGGPGTFAAMPEAVRNYCALTAQANVLDWRTDLGMEAEAAGYASLRMPVLLVRGERANPLMVAMTDELGEILPDVRPAVVAGAGHFLITTHARECAGLLQAFLAEVA